MGELACTFLLEGSVTILVFASLPDSFQVHGADFDNDSSLLVLEDTVTFSTRHANNIQQFCSIHHVVIYSFIQKFNTTIDTEKRTARRGALSFLPARRATQTPLTSTWKQYVRSSSQMVLVSLVRKGGRS